MPMSIASWILLAALWGTDAHPCIEPTTKTTRIPEAEKLDVIRRALATYAAALARAGLTHEAQRVLAVHSECGGDGDEQRRLIQQVDKASASARKEAWSESELKAQAKVAADLAARLARFAKDNRDRRIAAAALALDGSSAVAHAVLDHVKAEDGVWRSPALAASQARRLEMDKRLHDALLLDVEVRQIAADHPLLLAVTDGQASAVAHEGLVIQSFWPTEKLAIVFRTILRAMAYSNWLLHGELVVRHKPGLVLHMNRSQYHDLVGRAKATGKIEKQYLEDLDKSAFTYLTRDGGDSLYTHYAIATQGGMGSLGVEVLQLYDDSLPGWGWNSWYDRDPPLPLWAAIGHHNLVALSCLGETLSNFGIEEASASTIAGRKDEGFQLGRAGIVGCRAWLRQLAAEGRAPGLDTTMLDQVGKIVGVSRLKATSACEYLHVGKLYGELMRRYAEVHAKSRAASLVAKAESALEQRIPEFDATWSDWLLGGEGVTAVRELLLARVRSPAKGAEQLVLQALNGLRRQAGLAPASLNAELSAGALDHARYLRANPDQGQKWPDAHEERADRPGFSPRGAWTGGHSVIAFNGAESAIREWVGTFYHRIPLLHPGLLQVGCAEVDRICVLDVTSVVDPSGTWVSRYPGPDQRDVPLRFVPEMPNPIPERKDQSTLGYPITLQLGPGSLPEGVRITLRASGRGEEIDCYLSTPDAPTNPLLSFDDVWCLIPKKPLAPHTTYQVDVASKAFSDRWEFTTGA